jgi:hypothetical protein
VLFGFSCRQLVAIFFDNFFWKLARFLYRVQAGYSQKCEGCVSFFTFITIFIAKFG